MNITLRTIGGCALVLVAAAPPACGQIVSLGQPPRWQPYAAGVGAIDRRGQGASASILLGVHHPLLNPITGLIAVTGEGYGTAGGAFSGGGGRLMATSPVFGLSAGADWNVSRRRLDAVLSFETAIRRGGLLGHGTMLRLDWLPTRGRTLGIGMDVPVRQPLAGRTRPRHTDVRLPDGNPTADAAPLTTVAEAAALIRAYTNLYSDENERALRAATVRYHSYGAAVRAYENALTQAFGSESIAARARAGVLEDVLLPYDSLFGQVKEAAGGLRGLTSIARTRFERWVRDSAHVDSARVTSVLAVYARWVAIIEHVHDELLGQWKDSRLVWLPLQLALTAEQYDDQEEVDALIARIVGRPFTDRNALTYLRSSDLPLEIARSVYATREYHVLWTHDFRGQTESGAVDNIGYSMVADVYLPALIEAVKRYDSTGRMPAYMIFLDEYFYEDRNGRLWMTILADPLRASVRLPGENAAREAHLRQRQQELRAAVAASARLQRDAARAGGEAWLRRVVKVHVSITQPSDFSFRSHRIVPPIPFTSDNVLRDHRKIAFYDLNEADAYRGGLLVMGVGIGEHYASATWEDRGYRLRGPATLEVRAAARRLLQSNGFRDDEIPPPLRAVGDVKAVEQRMNLEDYVGRVLHVHNEVGFGRKQSSAVRAMLYSLAPPGSVIIVPDPLWLSEGWAAMLVGAAARGARVFVIAPAQANAPSPEATVMAREHDVMRRLLEIRDRLSAEIKEAGGEIRIGLYAAKAHVTDAEGMRREVRAGLDRAPWIRDLVPFDSSTFAVLERATNLTAGNGEDATVLARDEYARPPKLHQKTQLIARPGAIGALVRQPGWDDVLVQAMRAQSRQTALVFEQLGRVTPEVADDGIRTTDALLRGYELAVPPAERKRVSFYFMLGSQNEDPRGMIQDGEATVVVSGFHAAAGLVDLYFLMARSTWVTSEAQLDQYLPPPKGWVRRLARVIRLAL